MSFLKVLDIVVIEDSEKHAQGIVDVYKKAIRAIKKEELLKSYLGLDDVSVEWMKGTKQETVRNNEKYYFYDESIYAEIEQRINQNSRNGKRTGILLDVALSKEEYGKAGINDYSEFKIAKGIYERYDDRAGIYIVTSIREFSSQVLSLMGTKALIKRYISKALVTEYPSYGTIARTINYMYNREMLDERKEDELDQLSE